VIVEVRQLGGALAVPGAHPSAFCRRDVAFSLLTIGIDAPPIHDAVTAHGAAMCDAMAPWSAGAELPNFAPCTGAGRLARVYTPEALARLRSLSAASDPARILTAAWRLFADGDAPRRA
jgi:hypothetical protein